MVSPYVGLVDGDRQDAYYFANDVDEDGLQGMLSRMLASQSELDVEEVTEPTAEHARDLDLGA